MLQSCYIAKISSMDSFRYILKLPSECFSDSEKQHNQQAIDTPRV